MKDIAVDFVLRRIRAAKTEQELRMVWGNIAQAYQAVPEIQAAKDQRKGEV